MKRLLNLSLSARLLLIFVVTALVAMLLLASLFSRGLGSQWQRAIAPHLSQYVSYIRNDIGMPPNETRARELASRLPIDIQVHKNDVMLFSTRNVPLKVEEFRFFVPRRFRDEQRKQSMFTGLPPHKFAYNKRSHRPVMQVRDGNYTFYVEMGEPQRRDRRLDEMLYAIIGLGILLALCYWLIRKLLAPIGRLQTTVQAISDGDLDARTAEPGSNDLAQLANSVDTMAERIQKMLDAKRELLLAISHELRTPLTRARVAAELVEQTPFQQKIISNIDEMELLIGQLMESERLQGHSILNYQTVNLNELVGDIIEQLDKPVIWQALPSPVFMEADETRLALLLSNLLSNALTHGSPDEHTPAEVSVVLSANDSMVNIQISDNGPGIEAGYLDSITDAFYRPDSSRTRDTGGFGLGLYLCQRIAQAHGGTLRIESSVTGKSGTTVTVQLPIKQQ